MKYTYKDIIIDPQDERLKGAIGKKVYAEDNPHTLLKDANNDIPFVGILNSIDKDASCPFEVERKFLNKEVVGCPYMFIIVKKEPKVKYVPFDLSKKEDRDFLRGKWIRHKKYGTEILIDCFSIDTSKWYVNGYSAKPLFDNFLFLDGSPVGKKVEE